MSLLLDDYTLERLWGKIKTRYDGNINALLSDISDLKTRVGVLENTVILLGSDVASHINNGDIHVTASDKTRWNSSGALTVRTAFVFPSDWSGSAAPYSASVSVTGVTSNSKISVGLMATSTTSDAVYTDSMAAQIRLYSQGTNSITLRAIGDKPTQTYTLTIFDWGA